MDVVMIRHGMTAWNEAGRIQGHTDIPLCAAGRRALAGRRLPARFASYRVHSSPLARAVETAARLGLGAPIPDRRLMEMHWGEWEGKVRASLAAADPEGVARNTARGRDFRPPGGESPRELQARILDWARSAARPPPGGDIPVDGEPSAGSRRLIDVRRDAHRDMHGDAHRDGSRVRPVPPSSPDDARHATAVSSSARNAMPSPSPAPGDGGVTLGVVAVTHKGVIKATLGLACDWDLAGKNPVRLDWACAHRFRFDSEIGRFALEEPNIRLDAHE